MHRKEDSN